MTADQALQTLEKCRFCLMCRHLDPVSHVTFNEALTPHGIALTITSQRRGLIDWNEASVGVVYSDADGGNARAHCATSQPFSEAVASIKAELTTRGLAPQAVYAIRDQLERYHSPFGKDLKAAKGKGEVALFVGDEAYYLWPEVIPAVTKLLKALGHQAVLVGQGRSSGFLASSLGFPDLARAQAEAQLEEIRVTGAKQVMVLSAGDYFAFTQLYAERLGLTLPKGLKVNEVLSALFQASAKGKLAFKQVKKSMPYAYVDPTHAVRVPARFDAPRALLERVMPTVPLELFWRRDRAHPAGHTALQMVNPALAETLTRARLEDAARQGAKLVVCEDPGTLAQLQQYAKDFDLEVTGLYELLATQLEKG